MTGGAVRAKQSEIRAPGITYARTDGTDQHKAGAAPARQPVIFAGPMWKGLVEWTSAQMPRPGFELASPQDMRIPTCVDGADEAVAAIRAHHALWTAKQSQGKL
jgi:hypothetical protein